MPPPPKCGYAQPLGQANVEGGIAQHLFEESNLAEILVFGNCVFVQDAQH
jgi:hypothetical protein